MRPARSTLMRWSDGKLTELTAKPHDVGSRVHEYGGGAYVVAIWLDRVQRPP